MPKSWKNRVILACQIVLMVSATGATGVVQASDDCNTPLPRNMEIVEPDPNTPAEFAQFVGLWRGGKWDDKLCHTLVIESVDAEGNVRTIYSWGEYAGWEIYNPDFSRPVGRIEKGVLKLATFRNGAEVTYRMRGETLRGEYLRRGNVSVVDLVKATR